LGLCGELAVLQALVFHGSVVSSDDTARELPDTSTPAVKGQK
jgi:hypothetical protein